MSRFAYKEMGGGLGGGGGGLGSCMTVEIAVLGSPVSNSPYGVCGRKATLKWNFHVSPKHGPTQWRVGHYQALIYFPPKVSLLGNKEVGEGF